MTAYDDPAIEERAQDAGATAFFRKPFAGKSLLAAILRALGTYLSEG